MDRVVNFRHVRSTLCAGLVGLGGAVAAGWLLGVEPLKSVIPGYSTMKFNVALAFAVAGAGLWLAGRKDRWSRAGAAASGVALAALGAATLAEYIFGVDLGIDELVVRDLGNLTGSGHPGRMSPLTAFCWLTFGPAIALLAMGRSNESLRVAHLLSAVCGLGAFFAAAGYAFGSSAFSTLGFYTLVAIHTAVGLMACSICALMTRSGEGWLDGLAEAPAARSVLREYLPIAVVLPVGVGLLLLLGSGAGLYDASFAFAAFVPIMTGALLWLGVRTAMRARAAEALAREQLEELEAIYESAPLGLALLDPDLRFLRINRRLAEMNGIPARSHLGRTVGEVVPAIGPQVAEIAARLQAGEPIVEYEICGETAAAPGARRWWQEYWQPLRRKDGQLRGLSVVAEEITERKLAESRRKLLMDELNHRVRNTLAVVQSIARQTFTAGKDAAAAREAFEARLQALAGAHGILTRENWEGADLSEVIIQAAGTHAPGRLVTSGPPVALPPTLAVSLSLALHELATNAAKYGALSSPSGRVEVQWTLDSGPRRRLRLVWTESGGPPVESPARKGFGTRLLDRALSSGTRPAVQLRFEPDGVICEIETDTRLEDAARTPSPAAETAPARP